MNKIVPVFSLTLIFILNGCSPIIKTLAGIKDIRMENRESLKGFCKKVNFDLDDTYVKLKDFDYPDSSQINFEFADQVLVFNSDGNRILYNGAGTNNHCSMPGVDFFTSLDTPFLSIDTINNLKTHLNNYRNLVTDNKPNIIQSDYYIVYYWALWYKGLTKRNAKSLSEILSSKNDTIKIQCFYLNNDFFIENYPENTDFKKLNINASI